MEVLLVIMYNHDILLALLQYNATQDIVHSTSVVIH